MRRSDRLFDVIQRLRTATRPVTAAMLAGELEVTPRTVYRDIATLQARRVPIEGAPGIGYVLRKGFDLPPLMFTIDEVEAIAARKPLLKNYRVKRGLVFHPHVPRLVGLRLLRELYPMDLLQLALLPLRDTPTLRKREIDIRQPGATKRVSLVVAERVHRWCCIGQLIEPLADRLVRYMRIAD